WSTSWDQEELIAEMKKAHAKGTALVAMKTCSGGKHAFKKGEEPSYSGAVQWVRSQGYVHTTAVAMASFEEIDAHT
ncbi:MAG: hypothetical protein V5A59_12115, partial [Bacteroidales bacterium]